MKTICLDETAFYTLLDTVGEYMRTHFSPQPDRWVSDKEAMRLLNVRSKTTLQNIRDQGLVKFSQPVKKIILYDRLSILEYIESNVRATYNGKS